MDTNKVQVLSTGDGYGGGWAFSSLHNTLADARADIRDVEADVKETINNLTIASLKQSFDAERSALVSGFEAKFQVMQSENRLDNKIEARSNVLERLIERLGDKVDRLAVVR